MRTLRSPKDYTGPDLDVPSLTYRRGTRRASAPTAGTHLDLIPKELWAEYLLWVRQATAIPVRNGLGGGRYRARGRTLSSRSR